MHIYCTYSPSSHTFLYILTNILIPFVTILVEVSLSNSLTSLFMIPISFNSSVINFSLHLLLLDYVTTLISRQISSSNALKVPPFQQSFILPLIL